MAKFPASPEPLSKQDTYTTWPGGVDPTAKLYATGGKRKTHRSRRSSRSKTRKARKARKTRSTRR